MANLRLSIASITNLLNNHGFKRYNVRDLYKELSLKLQHLFLTVFFVISFTIAIVYKYI